MISILEQTKTITPEPLIERGLDWTVPVENDRLHAHPSIKADQTYISLEEVPVEIEAELLVGEAPDAAATNLKREALARKVGQILAAEETWPGAVSSRFWVAFNGLRNREKALSAARLYDVVRDADGNVAIEVIDRDGGIASIPPESEVHLLAEKQPRDPNARAKLSHGKVPRIS